MAQLLTIQFSLQAPPVWKQALTEPCISPFVEASSLLLKSQLLTEPFFFFQKPEPFIPWGVSYDRIITNRHFRSHWQNPSSSCSFRSQLLPEPINPSLQESTCFRETAAEKTPWRARTLHHPLSCGPFPWADKTIALLISTRPPAKRFVNRSLQNPIADKTVAFSFST